MKTDMRAWGKEKKEDVKLTYLSGKDPEDFVYSTK